LYLRGKPGHRGSERRAEETTLPARYDVALARGMEEYFDALHGSILLKANNAVNRPGKPLGRAAHRGLGSFAHTLGNIRMMGVKDYLHL
jgi:hypothetical protein